MSKKKVLFVVDTLAQHGAERYLYEIVKILIKNNFYVSVYSIVELSGDSAYYVDILKDLGVEIYFKSELTHPAINNPIIKKIVNSFSYRVANKLNPLYVKDKIKNNFMNTMHSYDIVSIIKWEVYIKDIISFDSISHKKIHILSAITQYVDYPYSNLPKGKTDFIVMYPEQVNEVLNNRQKREDINFFTIPLLIDNYYWPNRYNPKNDGVLRIGIFSRIQYDQPTIFILSIIHELKIRNIPVVLYFFGRYYDEKFYKHYIKTAEILKVSKDVKFMGHVEDLAEAIELNHLDIGVMNAFDSFVGYSSIELQSHGLPVIFFNITNSGYSSEYPIIHNTIPEVSDSIEHLWKDKSKLKKMSERTFLFAKEQYGSESNTKKVIAIYDL